MRTIHDPKWLKRFYAEHCHRGVQGAANKAALGRLRIEIEHWMRGVVKLHVCDSQGPLVTLGYNGLDAWPISASSVNAPLFKTDEDALTASVKKLLRAHDIIDKFDVVKVA